MQAQPLNNIIQTMSLTLTLSGNTSVLTAEYFPPLDLPTDYVCGLIDFHTYNSIPNVQEKNNNLFHVGKSVVEMPTGSYEIDDIGEYLNQKFDKLKNGPTILLKANNNTLKCEITSTDTIYFDRENSIGSLLGFSKRVLEASRLHTSDLPVNIIKVNAIRVECNLISGAFMNGIRVHTLHEFAPKVGPGYKIVEVPTNVIYLPVNTRRISSITLKLLDQDGDLINFRGEIITIRLHLKLQA